MAYEDTGYERSGEEMLGASLEDITKGLIRNWHNNEKKNKCLIVTVIINREWGLMEYIPELIWRPEVLRSLAINSAESWQPLHTMHISIRWPHSVILRGLSLVVIPLTADSKIFHCDGISRLNLSITKLSITAHTLCRNTLCMVAQRGQMDSNLRKHLQIEKKMLQKAHNWSWIKWRSRKKTIVKTQQTIFLGYTNVKKVLFTCTLYPQHVVFSESESEILY